MNGPNTRVIAFFQVKILRDLRSSPIRGNSHGLDGLQRKN
jgi:hypothetical protein